MKIEVNFVENLYLKAKNAFNECISNPDNDYLKEEIHFQIAEIKVVEDFIRFQFLKHNIDEFIVEVKLQLLSPNNHFIGSYIYFEDEKKKPLDDSLIFD